MATETEGAAAALELPGALAAPADLPAVDDPEDNPQAQDTSAADIPLAEPVLETASPPPIAQVVPPPAPEASPQESSQSEAGAETEVGGEEEQAPRAHDAPQAAAWAASEPPLPPPAGEVAAPDIGSLGSENRALERTAGEGLASAPGSEATPSEPPEACDSRTVIVAPETLPFEPEPREEPRREEVGDEAQPPLREALPVATDAPAETLPSTRHEPPPPELQQQEVAASAPDVPSQVAPSITVVPAAAWTQPVEAQPVEAAAAWPAPPAQPMPAWLPLRRPSADAGRKPPALRRALPYLRLALRGTALLTAGLIVTVLALVLLYRWVNPPVSALMIGRSLAGTAIERTWMPLERISPHLMRAVILSEDGGFCRHGGVDWAAIEEAIESDRGGSTVTMQVVKNLFLWPSRSYVRKAIEIGLAYLVEALWSKRRILEIYLNVAEWGDGVFGAEAAAQTHFGKRAARLTAEEAALLAAVLPNPIDRTAGAPSLMTGRLASRLLVRMRTSRADLSCVPVPRMEPRKAPQKSPQRTPEKAPLVQGPRMTL